MNVLMLQPSRPQTAGAALRLVATRLQLFEYQSVRFTCEGLNVSAGFRVRNTEEFISKCSNDTETPTVTCTIDFAFVSDSGEYWCEGGGRRSNSVSISVTAGSVILESPVSPVTEGDDVTLRCRNKTTSSNTADFFKDGRLIRSSSTGEMTISSMSKSDEGLYRCHISGAGESPESRLTVTVPEVTFDSVTRREDSNTPRAPVSLEAALRDPNRELFDKKKNKDAAHAADNLSLGLDTKPRTEKDH
ncbi:hypothetical protein ABVT39_010885 [Epinephelus coioides]